MIRAWRDPAGLLRIRLTEVVDSASNELEVTTVAADDDALAAVRNWLKKVRS